jgi:hypothetical protein
VPGVSQFEKRDRDDHRARLRIAGMRLGPPGGSGLALLGLLGLVGIGSRVASAAPDAVEPRRSIHHRRIVKPCKRWS